MKKLSIIAFFTCLVVGANAQIKQDAQGNYYAVKAAKVAPNGKQTGRTFTTAKGEVFPIYVSERGKFYILRTSNKTGKEYKQYLAI